VLTGTLTEYPSMLQSPSDAVEAVAAAVLLETRCRTSGGEAAGLPISFGADDAINLDRGGSATPVDRERPLNRPHSIQDCAGVEAGGYPRARI
jgi:hypothetical protein